MFSCSPLSPESVGCEKRLFFPKAVRLGKASGEQLAGERGRGTGWINTGGSKRRGAARGHRGGMGAKQSTPGQDPPPSHARNKGDGASGGRQAWEGDQPRLFWWFCGCCFPAISAGQHSWKAPAPGSPAVREGGWEARTRALIPIAGVGKARTALAQDVGAAVTGITGAGDKRKSPAVCQELSQQGWICARDTPSDKSRDRTLSFPGAGTRGLCCHPRVPTGFECPCCSLNPAHLHCTGISLLWRPRRVLSSGLRACLKAATPDLFPPGKAEGHCVCLALLASCSFPPLAINKTTP